MKSREPSAPAPSVSRRRVLQGGLVAAAMPILATACKTGPKYGPPGGGETPEPQPVTELTDGRSLYDDFDGHGNLQTIDGLNMAEPCRLSSRIWGGEVGTEIIESTGTGPSLAVVDDDGQRVEYRRHERIVEEITGYLRRNPRPVLGWEREIIDGWLNDRGRRLTAGLESRPLDMQAKVIHCLLDRRRDLLNERGGILSARVFEGSLETLLDPGSAGLAGQGFSEAEVLLLVQLAAEKDRYDRLERSPLRGLVREGEAFLEAVVGARRVPSETAYIYDSAGRLLESELHIPGRPYRSSRRLRLVNPFEAARPSSPGPVRGGQPRGEGEVVRSAQGGCLLRVTNTVQPYIKIMPNNPEVLDFADFRSFSADVLLSSASSGRLASAGLDYHTTIPEQELGRSWYTQIVIRVGSAGPFLLGHYTNINTGVMEQRILGSAALDTWYNLRLVICTSRDDPELGAEEMRIDFFVDGVRQACLFPEDAPILLDPERTGLGPHRSLTVYAAEGTGGAVGLFDNVRAVYENRIA